MDWSESRHHTENITKAEAELDFNEQDECLPAQNHPGPMHHFCERKEDKFQRAASITAIKLQSNPILENNFGFARNISGNIQIPAGEPTWISILATIIETTFIRSDV